MGKKIASLTALIFSDFLVLLISFWLAYLIRRYLLTSLFPVLESAPLYPYSHFLNHFYMAVVWIFIFAYEKLYTKRYPIWSEVRVSIKSATLSSFVIMVLIFATKKQLLFPRSIVILAWLLSLSLFPLFRYITKTLLVKHKIWTKKLVILGVQQTSLQIVKNIRKNRTMGYEVSGFLDDDPQKIGKSFSGTQVLGPISDLENLANTQQAKDIMITTPHMSRSKLKEFFAKCESLSDSMWLIPRSGDFITEGVEIEVLGDVLTLHIKKNLAKPWNIFVKSLFEKTLTLLLILILLPIFIVIAVAIKLDSKGPVLFTQDRLGQNRKTFNLFKFRSMYVDSDSRLSSYLGQNEAARHEWDRYKKLKNHDPRVTRVGKFIRRYSLDELPQLFNVLSGQMSLVGPRPYLSEELAGKDMFKNTIAKVKPGITGLWQTSGRSELPFDKRIALDEYYIRNWSLWIDIVILLKSIKVLFSTKGAY
jgi:Undecaprenyl-phosphate galactose phosphotransferase WbaP